MESLREHLEHPAGRGLRPAGAFDGSAGGAACGDLVRISLRVEGERVTAAGFDASGCGTMTAAGSAAVTLVEGAHVLDAARVGAHAIAAELGGLARQVPRGRPRGRRAAPRARRRRARAAALPADPGRARGDERRRRLRGRGAAGRARRRRGHARALGRPGERRRGVVLLGPRRPHRALARARDGLPHFTLDLRAEFRAGVVDPFLADHEAGLTPNPCVRCNGHVRLDAMLDFADRVGAATLATGHYARTTADGLLRAAADPAKDQTYMLAAVAPATLARLRFPLGDLTKPEVRALAAEAGLPVASKADSQDLCFLAGTGKAAFLARHGACPTAPGDIVDARAPSSAATAATTTSPSASAAGSASRRAEPLYVLATTRAPPRHRRPARRARHPRGRGPRRAPAPRRRRGRRGEAPLPLQAGRVPRRGRPRAPAPTRLRARARRPGRRRGARPDRLPARGDVVVGYGTISSRRG